MRSVIAFGGALVVLVLSVLTVHAQDLSFAQAPTQEALTAYLHRKNPRLDGRTQLLLDEGKKWDVDPRLVVAISGAESTFGRHVCAEYNAWNWFYNRTCPPSTFSSYARALEP